MLLQESEWYRDMIRRHVREGSLVLNIGSSTKQFVEVKQPYIKLNVLDELAKKHCAVKNIDIKVSEGVDLVGDISDPSFVEQLRALTPDVVICANAHEHVAERETFSAGLESLVDEGTLLIVSAPCVFPYHEDPIDTMYRVDVAELSKEFPALELVEGRVISTWHFSSVRASGLHVSGVRKVVVFLKDLLRFTLFVGTGKWSEANVASWMFRRVYETCAVYRRRKAI